MSKAALRQARLRERRRQGLQRLQLDIPEDSFAAALIESGRLSPDETQDPLAVSRAAAELLIEWSERWLGAERR